MRELLKQSLRETRLMAMLAGAFGAVALGIALVGLYGVTSYAVAQRTRELGIRMALGARTRDVLHLVLGETLALVAAGAAAGALAAAGAMRAIAALLYGVTPADPSTFLAAGGLLAAAALAASYLPARRALRADPLRALRQD